MNATALKPARRDVADERKGVVRELAERVFVAGFARPVSDPEAWAREALKAAEAFARITEAP